jgi:hypothetical protein
MKTKKLFIAFEAVTAFEVGFRSAELRGRCQAAGWPAAEATAEAMIVVPNATESLRPVHWPRGQASRLERETTPNELEAKILTERPL